MTSEPADAPRRATPRPVALFVIAALVLGGLAGFAAGRRSEPNAPPAPATSGTNPGAASSGTLASRPVDTGFALDMIDHHQQALQMALIAIDKATTVPVRSLALQMVTTQQRESGELRQFLRDRGVPEGEQDREVMGWMGHALPHDQMPGLARPEQVVALTNASGDEVDRLFLDLMIRHHEGGAEMAEFAATHAESAAIRDLAQRIVVFQKRETSDLRQYQEELGG